MISHLYIDNFSCFTNFEWKPAKLSLLLGANGSGKSSVFDVIMLVRNFACSTMTATEAFPRASLTAWDTRSDQTLEIGIKGNGGQYTYRFVVEHNMDLHRNRLKHEFLAFDGITLYEFKDGKAHLFRDDGSPGPTFPVDWSRSILGTMSSSRDNTRLTWFKDRIENIVLLSPSPSAMAAESSSEETFPDKHLAGYVSWLRDLVNDLEAAERLKEYMKPVLPGFTGMRFVTTGENRKELRFTFESGDAGREGARHEWTIPFDRLSDGQRCLAVLYTSLVAARGRSMTLLWDEPDNFVALRELQPWLKDLEDMVEREDCQCMVASHHPEFINELAPEHGVLFFRDGAGPVRTKSFEFDKEGVSASELVARGWEA